MQTPKVQKSLQFTIYRKISRWRRVISLFLLPFYGLIGWLRTAESLKLWGYLVEINLWPRPLYFAISGVMIGTGFTLAWFFSLFKIRMSCLFNQILGIVFLLWFWVDRIWFSTREAFFNQLGIALLITFVTLFWIIFLNPKPNQKSKEV